MLDIQRGYTTLVFCFLILKSIPNSPTKCSESHLSSFRGKKMDIESEKSVLTSVESHSDIGPNNLFES